MSDAPPVTSDFYDLEGLLSDDERALLHRVRAFMDTHVEPVINEYWTRGEFPHELVPGLAELGIAGNPYSGYGCPGRSSLFDGMVAMELSRGDASISTFMGVHGGLAMKVEIEASPRESSMATMPSNSDDRPGQP